MKKFFLALALCFSVAPAFSAFTELKNQPLKPVQNVVTCSGLMSHSSNIGSSRCYWLEDSSGRLEFKVRVLTTDDTNTTGGAGNALGAAANLVFTLPNGCSFDLAYYNDPIVTTRNADYSNIITSGNYFNQGSAPRTIQARIKTATTFEILDMGNGVIQASGVAEDDSIDFTILAWVTGCPGF